MDGDAGRVCRWFALDRPLGLDSWRSHSRDFLAADALLDT
jgi:hypothetical protein